MNSCEYHAAYNTKLLDRLEPLAELSASATLCMLRGTHTLYVVKHLPVSSFSMLQALTKAISPRIAVLRAFRCYGDEIEAAFDYADGETLHARLESSGPMEAVSAAHICMDVCEGLAALHSVGVVHRDINPNNIVLTRDGRAVIIDCGIARSFLGERTADTMILGTPGYAAPEQFGFTQSDARTDLYAVGVLFNVMITGELPNETMAAEKPGKIVSRCIAIDAKNRPASAEELRSIFGHFADGTPEKSGPGWLRGAIPGFRSKEPNRIVLAVLLWCLWLIFASASMDAARQKGHSEFASLTAFFCITLMPLIGLGNLFYLRDAVMKLFGLKESSKSMVAWILAIGGFIIGGCIINGLG